jgi:GMP synthase-like glutamine amidotransferase
MPSAVVLAHRTVAHELGHLESWLDRNGFLVRRIFREDKPGLPNADLLIVLGSPTSVATGYCEPPADVEIAMVGEWINQSRPYLGICFGAQVLARARGGSVRRMANTHRSFAPMTLAGSAPKSLNGSWALWHDDAITAPSDSSVLASMPHADTVFVHGSAWGVQPHIEFTPEIVVRLGKAMNIAGEVLEPMYQAMKNDDPGLSERTGQLLDTFWASANSIR